MWLLRSIQTRLIVLGAFATSRARTATHPRLQHLNIRHVETDLGQLFVRTLFWKYGHGGEQCDASCNYGIGFRRCEFG